MDFSSRTAAEQPNHGFDPFHVSDENQEAFVQGGNHQQQSDSHALAVFSILMIPDAFGNDSVSGHSACPSISSTVSSAFHSLRGIASASNLHHNALEDPHPANRLVEVVLSLAGSVGPAAQGDRIRSPSPCAAFIGEFRSPPLDNRCISFCRQPAFPCYGYDEAVRGLKRPYPEPLSHPAGAPVLEEWSIGPGRPFPSEAMRRRRRW